MTASIRQYTDTLNSNKTFTSNIHVSFSSATVIGNPIVVVYALSYDNGLDTGDTCSDSKGNTYVKLMDTADSSTSGDEQVLIFLCASPIYSLTTSDYITTGTTGTDYMELFIFEIAGTNGYLASNGSWQSGITTNTANNLTTGNLALGTGLAFVLSLSLTTISSGTSPYYPTAGTGLTMGGNWFYDSYDFGGTSTPLASWGYGTYNNAGTSPIHWSSPTNATNGNFVTQAVAFSVAPGSGAALSWLHF